MILAVIPARSGSKRIPNKNMEVLGGKTLVQRALDIAVMVADAVVVSSDSVDILNSLDGEFIHRHRPSELSTGYKGSGLVTWRDALVYAEYETGFTFDQSVLLEPSSPFRTAKDVQECIAHPAVAVATVNGMKFDPHLEMEVPLWNGLCYCASRQVILDKTFFVDPMCIQTRKVVNIDYPIDLEFARWWYEETNQSG